MRAEARRGGGEESGERKRWRNDGHAIHKVKKKRRGMCGLKTRRRRKKERKWGVKFFCEVHEFLTNFGSFNVTNFLLPLSSSLSLPLSLPLLSSPLLSPGSSSRSST